MIISVNSSSVLFSSSLNNENLFLIEDKIPPPDDLEIVEPNLTFEEFGALLDKELPATYWSNED